MITCEFKLSALSHEEMEKQMIAWLKDRGYQVEKTRDWETAKQCAARLRISVKTLGIKIRDPRRPAVELDFGAKRLRALASNALFDAFCRLHEPNRSALTRLEMGDRIRLAICRLWIATKTYPTGPRLIASVGLCGSALSPRLELIRKEMVEMLRARALSDARIPKFGELR